MVARWGDRTVCSVPERCYGVDFYELGSGVRTELEGLYWSFKVEKCIVGVFVLVETVLKCTSAMNVYRILTTDAGTRWRCLPPARRQRAPAHGLFMAPRPGHEERCRLYLGRAAPPPRVIWLPFVCYLRRHEA
ncbi:hypothetical protein EVAR_59940_1 [Eumeta japonica]|uniref:Uncharacterized protein n=1 Tax=Eumeta variegata TaxID=151549 RepID=A0A4C1ZIJ8_EUMVA|nr:hypothetical protein EVAR_59940_1 [Eumeta japonica]